MHAQIVPQNAKPLSSFDNEEGMRLLLGPNYQEAEITPFALADLNTSGPLDGAVTEVTNLEFVKALLNHLGVDFAVRCLRSEPRLHSRDYAKREFISPLLYVASILAGKLMIVSLLCTTALGDAECLLTKSSATMTAVQTHKHASLTNHLCRMPA